MVTRRAGYVYGTEDGVPVLFSTADGGARFRLVPLPTAEGKPLALAQLAFRTGTTGLAIDVYGDAWLTTDGGASWHLLAALPLGRPQSAVWTGPKNLFAVVALKQIRKTAAGQTRSGHLGLVASYDGAVAFTPLVAWPWPPLAQSFDSAALAAHGSNIWLFAYAGLLASGDGGATWTEIRLPARHLHPVSLAFTDVRHGWLLTTSGALFVTTDGGHTWRQVTQGR